MTARSGDGRRREKPELIADEVRALIVGGELAEGDVLGQEPELIERFGVSRPSLREALRILEAEGLISVVRGAGGGVVVHEPDERMTARTAALVLRARNVPLADVHEARRSLELHAVRAIATSTPRTSSAAQLRALVEEQERCIDDPDEFSSVNARFHEQLVALAGNQTMSIVAEMLNEIVARAVTTVSQVPGEDSLATRRRGIRSQRRLVELLAEGDEAAAEEHWHAHLTVVGKVLLGQQAATMVDLLDHY
ncbi:MAG: FCD domain-containing protein [Acidimicrobiales bacterium]|nr:FCD domain-containing protein [Acidimicrobiales bacterium]